VTAGDCFSLPSCDCSLAFPPFFVCPAQDQQRALQLVRSDVELSHLQVIEALFDVRVQGVPALKFMGDIAGTKNVPH